MRRVFRRAAALLAALVIALAAPAAADRELYSNEFIVPAVVKPDPDHPERKPVSFDARDPESGIAISAEAADGVLPEDAVMRVNGLTDGAQRAEIEAMMTESGYWYDGYYAFDISFENAAREKIEPNGEVKVSLSMPADVVPEDAMHIELLHFAEDGDGCVAEVETVADTDDVAEGTVEVSGGELTAEFGVESFSTFTLKWTNVGALTVNHVSDSTYTSDPGSNGRSYYLDGAVKTLGEIGASSAQDDYSFFSSTIYTLEKVAIASSKSDALKSTTPDISDYYLKYDTTAGKWLYCAEKDGTYVDLPSGNLYFIYSKSNSSGYGLDAENTKMRDCKILYDVLKDGVVDSTSTQASDKVTSVTLSGLPVTWRYAGANTGDVKTQNIGTDQKTYFPNAQNGSNYVIEESSMTIQPKAGFYVKRVTVTCSKANGTPFACQVYTGGNAFTATFGVSAGGAVTIPVTSKDFSHPANNQVALFILIEVAPIPSPLLVEYDYGIIKDKLSNYSTSPFATPSGWTTANGSNVYTGGTTATGGIDTRDTQQRFVHDGEAYSEQVENFRCYANTVTDAAKRAAAEAGYVFNGWKAEYYTNKNPVATPGSYNNYNYNLSGKTTTIDCQPGDQLGMTSNIRLVAQWKPAEVKLTKTVTGLEGQFVENHTYGVRLQCKNASGNWVNYDNNIYQMTVNGNGSTSILLSPMPLGEYRLVEVNGNTNLTKGSGTSKKTMYISVDDQKAVSFTADDLLAGNYTKEVKVINAYTPQPIYKLTINKTLSGNFYDVDKEFSFTVMNGTVEWASFTLKGGESKEIKLPENASVTVTESGADDYTFSVTSLKKGTTNVTKTVNGHTVSFTMPQGDTVLTVDNKKEIEIDNGVSLDGLPYALLLALTAGAALAVLARRRRRG